MTVVKQRLATTRLSDGTEIAYAVAGSGPLLVHAPGWLTHLERSWAMPPERGFYEALARGRTLVRYDRPGCGLSGTTSRALSMDLEVETLAAVVAHVTSTTGRDGVELFGASLGAAAAASFAAADPGSVSRLVLYGGWVRGRDVATAENREHVLGLIGEQWGLGSDVLAGIFAPSADAATRAAFIDYQRESTTPQHARNLLTLAYDLDITDRLGSITAPTLVIHRERDRAAPLEQGRALAAGIPGASLEVLDGRDHLPYMGDAAALATSVRRFLGLPAVRAGAAAALTDRQRQVARLVTQGLTNREIAAELTITERSVESHVERIRDRLGFRSRSQVAAWYTAGGR
ncbi:alpha/beta fold hydrolase [Marmoricola sp. URHB0036]|uniref:alpha/beta fold hydrolase n=1 Tax=Marmoricola sp. URHB0036 TaxID=1298863 RepID=UPI0004267544